LKATPDLPPARTDDTVLVELADVPPTSPFAATLEAASFDTEVLAALADPVYEIPLDSVVAERSVRLVRSESGEVVMAPLAPAHLALTALAQPTLLWASSTALPRDAELRFVLTEEGAIDPVLRRRIPPPQKAGLQRLHIAHFEVALPVGVPFTWSIVWRQYEATTARDVMTQGTIQRIAADSGAGAAANSIEEADIPLWPARLADEGLWYDSATALAYLMDVAPERREPRRALQSLLLQEELAEAADLVD
jgi:hypothetical protein